MMVELLDYGCGAEAELADKLFRGFLDQIYIHKTTGTRNKYMSRVFNPCYNARMRSSRM